MTPRQYARAQAIADDKRADPNERDNARRLCAEYEAIHGKPRSAPNKRPWWTLKVAMHSDAWWLSNDREFRKALRGLRDGKKQFAYMFEFATVKDIQDGRVDWANFPETEPWRVPNAMQEGLRAIEQGEEVVQWPEPIVRMGTVRRKRDGLRDGELPGRRSGTRKSRKAR